MQQEISQYIRTANLIIRTAEHGFFDSLNEKTKEAVHTLMQCMFWVDRYVDVLDESRRKQVEKNIIGYLGKKEQLAIENELEVCKSLAVLKDILDEFTDTQRLEFLNKTAAVFDSGRKLSSARTPREFIQEREEEAKSTADMILILASELGANEKFANFFREVTIVGNLIDSIEDARDDKSSGKIAVKPIQIYFSLAQKTLTHMVTVIKMHPQKKEAFGVALTWILRHVGLKSEVPWQAKEHFPDRPAPAATTSRSTRPIQS